MRARKHLRAFGAIALALAALTASAVVVFSPSDAAQLATTAGPSTTDTLPDQSDTSAPPPATESVIEDERPLVVEPSEGLRDGQPLRVRIRRPPARILVDICVTGDDSGCAFFPATTRTSATFTETASRFIVTKSGAIVDCAERAGRCVLRVYDVSEIPLTFDATEPAPQFGYSADRTTQLRGRHSIRLSGTTPSRFVTLAQCFATAPSPSCVPLRGLAVVPGRAFAGDVVVTRALMSGDGTFDCALRQCELRVSGNVPQHPVLARFPLEFATDEPLAIPYLQVEDGPTPDAGTCEKRMYTTDVDHTGSVTVAVTLRERPIGFASSPSDNIEFDCSAHTCLIRAVVQEGPMFELRFRFDAGGIARFERQTVTAPAIGPVA